MTQPTLDLLAARNQVEKVQTITKKATRLVPREMTLSVTYSPPDSDEPLSAGLRSHILNGDERRQRDRLMVVLAGGPVSDFAISAQSRFLALATLTYCLVDPPTWVLRWIAEDDSLLFQLFEEVMKHERLYFRGDGGQGQTAAERPRVAVASSLPAKPAEE